MQGHDQRRELILDHVLQLVDEEDDRGFLFGRRLADGGQKLAKIIVEIAAVGETLQRCEIHPDLEVLVLDLQARNEAGKGAERLATGGLERLAPVELQERGPQRRREQRWQGSPFRGLNTDPDDPPRLGVQSDAVQEDRLTDPAQAIENQAAGGAMGANAVERDRRLFDRGITPSQLRRRRARAWGIGIGPGVHL